MSTTVISFKYEANAENFLRTTDRIEKQLGGLEKAAGGFGTVMKGALLGVGFAVAQKGIELVGGAFAGSIGAASTFEKTMSGVKAVSNATGEEMRLLADLALRLGKETSFSASQAAAGIEELLKGGLTVPQIMDGAAQAVLNLAAAGGVSLPEAAAIAATAMNVFSLKGSDMAHVSDLIAGAANASSLSVTDFRFALSQVGAVADGAGQSFDDVAQAIAVMGAKGLIGSDAGTSLKTMLSNLQPTTKAQTAAMRELGLITADGSNQFINANGSFKSMSEIAEILQNSTAGLTDAQRQLALETIFGSDAVRAATIFAKSGGEGFAEMATKMGLVTAESVGFERLNNTAGSIEQLKGSLETAGITIGRVFLPYGRQLIDWATGAVNGLIPLLETGGPLLAAKLATGGRALLGFGRDAVAMLGPVKDAAVALLSAFQTGDFNAAFGPLLAALDAVFGPGTSGKVALFVSQLLRGFQLVRDGFLTVQQALAGKWVGDDTVQPAVRAVGDFALRLRHFALTAKDVFFNQVLPAVQQVAGFIRDHMGTIAKVVAIAAAAFAAFSIIATVVGWVTTAIAVWAALSGGIAAAGGVLATIVALLGGPVTLAIVAVVAIVGLLAAAWANNWGDIQGKVAAVWAWLQPVLVDLGARLSQFWTDILPQLSAAWQAVSTAVVAAAQWLWSGIQTVFGAVAGFLVAHGDQILAVLGGAWALIQNTINTYLGVLSNLIRGVLALISGDWDGAWAYIRQAAQIAWDGLVAFFGAAGPILLGVLAAIWGGIQTAAGAAWDAIAGYVGSKFSEIGTTIRDYVTQYKNETGQQFSEMGTAVRDKVTQMKNEVGGKFSEIGTGIQGKLGEIQKWWSDGWATVAKTLADTWDGITSAVGGAFSALGTATNTFITVTIPGKFRDARQTVVDAVMGIFQGAGSVKADLDAWMVSRTADVTTFIGTTVPKAFTDKAKDVRDAVLKIFDGAGSVKSDLDTWLLNRASDVTTFIGTTVPIAFFAGQKAVREKFMDVFEGNSGGVKEALAGWLDNRITDVGTFIGTTLPDKFFAGQKAVKDKFMQVFEGTGSVLAAFTGWIGTDTTGILGTAWTFIRTTLPTTLGNGITAVVEKFLGIFSGEGGVSASFVSWVGDGSRGFIGTVWTFVTQTLPDAFSNAVGTVVAGFEKIFKGENGVSVSFSHWIGNDTSGFLGSAKTFITTTLPKVFTDAALTVKDAVLNGFVLAQGAIAGILGGFGKNAVGALNTVLTKVRSFAEGVKLLVNWVAEKLSATGIVGDIPPSTISVDGLASGTRNWGGGMAWVGEGPGGAGAELAYLPRGATVLPHRESMALVRQGVVAAPQSGPALVPGFAGGLDALGGIFEVLKKGAGWLYDQAKSAVGLGDLSLPASFGDIGGKLAGKVKDWALGSIDKMLKAATPVPSVSGDQIQRGIGFAEAQMGKPYVWGGGHGGSQPIDAAGWDCSGFVSAVLNAMGISHPRYGIVTSFHDWMEQGPKTGYVDIGTNNPYAAPDVQHVGIALGGTQYESGGPFGGVGKNGTNFQYWGHPPGLTAAPAPAPGQGGGFTGNGSNVVAAILDKIGNDSYTGLAMLEGSWMEGGWGPTFGVGDPDQGGSFGPFQINWNAHHIPRAQAEDPAFAVDYMYPGYFAATRDRNLPWGSDPGMAAALAAFYAERPFAMYPDSRVYAAYAASGPIVGMADGGVITEPIVGRGQRTGRGYTFGEAGPEGVFNADQMAALGARGGGETHIHHENHYTIQSTEPTVTVEGFKREERREARLRGYGR